MRRYHVTAAGSCCAEWRWTAVTVVVIVGISATRYCYLRRNIPRTVHQGMRLAGLAFISAALLIPGVPLFAARQDVPGVIYVDHEHDFLDIVVESMYVYDAPIIGYTICLLGLLQLASSILVASDRGEADVDESSSRRGVVASLVLVLAVAAVPVFEWLLRRMDIPMLGNRHGRYAIEWREGLWLLISGGFFSALGTLGGHDDHGGRFFSLRRPHLVSAAAVCVFGWWISVALTSASSKEPQWRCKNVQEVQGRYDEHGLRRAVESGLPFVVRGGASGGHGSRGINAAALVSHCGHLRNTARSDVLPHASSVREPLRSLVDVFLRTRRAWTGGGFRNFNDVLLEYPNNLSSYHDFMPDVRPLGSFGLWDRLVYGLQPGVAYLADVAFENDSNDLGGGGSPEDSCPFFASAFQNLTNSWEGRLTPSQDTHLFLTTPGQQWSMAHAHVAPGDETGKQWRWSWQIEGSKRWNFWGPGGTVRDLLRAHGGFTAKTSCCDTFGFAHQFGPSSRQDMMLLESLPCQTTDVHEGDLLVFSLNLPHSLYSLDEEITKFGEGGNNRRRSMVSTASHMPFGVLPIVISRER